MSLVEKWDEYWLKTESLEDSSPYARWLRNQRLSLSKENLSSFSHDLSLLDVGCGSGASLVFLREIGFKNSVGIDYSKNALIRCEEKGLKISKDVFLMDAKETTFPDKSFDIVFQEGLWEHFKDCRPLIQEASRLSRNYIITMQPNHFSPMGFVLKVGGLLFRKTMRELKEYSYPLSYFTKILNDYDFKLISINYTLLHEQAWLLYRRERQ